MKKIRAIVPFLLLLSITGCAAGNTSKAPDNTSYTQRNTIYMVDLTKEEKDIINLVGVKSNIDIYEYQLKDDYKAISIWLETYQEGELMSTRSRMDTQLTSDEGRLSLMVDKSSHYKWTITNQGENGTSRSRFETHNDFETNKDYSVGRGTLNEPVEIMPDKEIILGTYLFDDGNGMSIYDNQYYAENPEVLSEYDYVYLIKCQFSNKSIDESNTVITD